MKIVDDYCDKMTVNRYVRIKWEGCGVATPLVGKLNQKGSYFAIVRAVSPFQIELWTKVVLSRLQPPFENF